jgi:hypothetical protein
MCETGKKWRSSDKPAKPFQYGVGGDNGTLITCQNPHLAQEVADAMNAYAAEEALGRMHMAMELVMETEGDAQKKARELYAHHRSEYRRIKHSGRDNS